MTPGNRDDRASAPIHTRRCCAHDGRKHAAPNLDAPRESRRSAERACTEAAWQAYKRTIRRPLQVRAYRGTIRIRAYPDSAEAGRFIYFNGVPDHVEATLMSRVLRHGDGFVDGGAHIGTYALLAASLVGSDGHVDCFEGAPTALARLCENIALNGFGNVTVHAAALSDTPAPSAS